MLPKPTNPTREKHRDPESHVKVLTEWFPRAECRAGKLSWLWKAGLPAAEWTRSDVDRMKTLMPEKGYPQC